VLWLSDPPRKVEGPTPSDFDARLPIADALSRISLRSCGVRLLVSDLLFEAALGPIFRRLAEGAARLALVQVLDASDEDPQGGEGARLLDSETDQALDRLLTWDVLGRYRKRFAAHQAAVDAEARKVRASLCRVSAGEAFAGCVRSRLAGVVLEPRAR
jgi:hypothetical protein